MSFKFKRSGIGVKGIKKRIKDAGTVDVGIIDAGKHTGEESTVAEVAFYNEFGTSNIPERSFIRSTIKEKKKEIIALQKKLVGKILKGELTNDKALGYIGIFVADEIKKKIVKLRNPANAPSTVEAKGSNNPLVDTVQLRNSVTYEVNR